MKFILDAERQNLPPDLRNADETKWLAWARREDKAIRARLEQGDLDSMANLLLYGTSFTGQPRVLVETLDQALKSGVLRARVDDLAAGLRTPGENERLIFLQHLLRNQGIDPDDPKATGAFIYKNLLRVLEQRKTLGEQAAKAQGAARSLLFQDRGLSLDTGIVADFSIDETLRDLKQRGVLRPGQVMRAAVIGPGLDFIDKNEDAAFDYYPAQTVQPFALYDSLARLELAKSGNLRISIFDISSRVIEHIQRARERAAKNNGYLIQLPRDIGASWPAGLMAYWRSLGDRVGTGVAPIKPPQLFSGLETRAVRIRPGVVQSLEPVDLNIVLERLDLAPAERFDVIVATNIFVYYDAFQQALALENAGAMLKPGGLLLTNDRLPTLPGGSMSLRGATVVPFTAPGAPGPEGVLWYQKR